MDEVDYSVLKTAIEWRKQQVLWLVTIVRTYGSSPRPAGSLLLIRPDGQFVGSVSGGCIEDDLVEKARNKQLSPTQISRLKYGGTDEEARLLGLPCGGVLDLVIEPILDFSWIELSLTRIAEHRLVTRNLDLATGHVVIEDGIPESQLAFDGMTLTIVYGPLWRLLIIGAGQTTTYLAQMAQALNFSVTVCDPRIEFRDQWHIPDTKLISDMPDDAVITQNVDSRTAVIAVSHDRKLDDMALLEALKSPAFYVGALGSKLNNDKRRERLALFDLSAEEIARLHGPIGINIHSKTPPEIAISILAHIISIKNQLSIAQEQSALACIATA